MESNLGALVAQLTALVRHELAFAAAELSQKARDAARHTLRIAIAVVLIAVALLVLVAAVVLGLGSVVPMWVSALVIATLMGSISYAVLRSSTSALRSMTFMPEATLAGLEADKAWTKQQIEETRAQVTAQIGSTLEAVVAGAKAQLERIAEP